MKRWMTSVKTALVGILLTSTWFVPNIAGAHCDTLDGPVVTTAERALEGGDVTPVLKWVRKEDEREIRELFKKTLTVRKQGKEAKELADMYFFETLVRIHRTGEGAPYTGLKREPAEPVILAADKALEDGSVADLLKLVNDAVTKGMRERFERAREAKKDSDRSIESGRKFVEAYVEFTHHVERLHTDALTGSGHGEEHKAGAEGQHGH